MTSIGELAAGLDDGYAKLLAQVDEMKELQKQNSADYPVEREPSIAAAEALAAGVSLRDAAAAEITDRRVRASVLDYESVLIQRADSALREKVSAWVRSHEAKLCAAVQDARLMVQKRAQGLVPKIHGVTEGADLATHPAAALAYVDALDLMAEWDGLARVHHQIIKSTEMVIWPGVDFVRNYQDAWPFWFVHKMALDLTTQGQAPAGFLGTEDAPWDMTVPALDRMRQIARVELWTPTGAQLTSAVEKLNQELYGARAGYVRASAEERQQNVRVVTIDVSQNTDHTYKNAR